MTGLQQEFKVTESLRLCKYSGEIILLLSFSLTWLLSDTKIPKSNNNYIKKSLNNNGKVK